MTIPPDATSRGDGISMLNTGRHDIANDTKNAHAMVGRRLADVERDLVLATLARCAGNRTWAADMLGLAPLELRDRLLRYGRVAEQQARDVARREAVIEDDIRTGTGPRPTYVPSPALLA